MHTGVRWLYTLLGIPPGTPGRVLWGVIGRGLAAAVVLIGLGLLLSIRTPWAISEPLLESLADVRTPGRIQVARLVSGLGNFWVVGAGCVAVCVALAVLRHPIARETRLLLWAAYGGALVVTAPLKLLTVRSRPDDALVDALSSAYPSGHALRVAAVYGLLAWGLYRWADSRRAAIGLASVTATVVLVIVIVSTRVFLWVHWPSDVVVGFLLGGLWLVVIIQATAPLRPPASPGDTRPVQTAEGPRAPA